MNNEIIEDVTQEIWRTEVMDSYKKLMRKMVKTELPEQVLLEYVMESLQQEKEHLFGDFLRKYFTKKGLHIYFRNRVSNLNYGSIEYYEFLRTCLNWGFDMDMLQQVFETDTDGIKGESVDI